MKATKSFAYIRCIMLEHLCSWGDLGSSRSRFATKPLTLATGTRPGSSRIRFATVSTEKSRDWPYRATFHIPCLTRSACRAPCLRHSTIKIKCLLKDYSVWCQMAVLETS